MFQLRGKIVAKLPLSRILETDLDIRVLMILRHVELIIMVDQRLEQVMIEWIGVADIIIDIARRHSTGWSVRR